jgi:hypothetical protein
MNDYRHYHTESERRQLDGVVHDAEMNGWEISKMNRMKSRINNLPDSSLVDDHMDDAA